MIYKIIMGIAVAVATFFLAILLLIIAGITIGVLTG
jgi:hypothetical protein